MPGGDGRADILQRSFDFAVRVVRLSRALGEKWGVGGELAKQVFRSGTSIGANIEEAQAGQSRADFVAKMSIAQKEARETLYWLRVLTASEVVPASRLKDLIDEAQQINRIIASILITTKRRKV